ncbi:hypothetical protein [Streptomyces umbrinus]|uniref:hypothetical protein n=1 Tax=Streptomyces umbrinus TaxID=67370 RepID=UPI003C2DAD19
MSNLRELGIEEATLKALADTVTDRLKAVRAQTQAGLDDAEEQSGTRQVVAKLPNGTQVATLSLTEPKPEAKITDAEAFQAWVMETFPDEIQRRFVAEVRAAFAEKLLGQMTAAGVARLLDTETGELHDVPGVEVKATRSRNHSLRFKPGGRDAIAAAWQAGELALPGVPTPAAVESGEGDTSKLLARIAELEERDEWLSALEAAGVDNWQGIDVAHEIRRGGAE